MDAALLACRRKDMLRSIGLIGHEQRCWKVCPGATVDAESSSSQVKEDYVESLEALPLPVAEDALDARHERALTAALAAFDADSFGVAGSPDLDVRSPGYTAPAHCGAAVHDLTCVLQLLTALTLMPCLSAMLGQMVPWVASYGGERSPKGCRSRCLRRRSCGTR